MMNDGQADRKPSEKTKTKTPKKGQVWLIENPYDTSKTLVLIKLIKVGKKVTTFKHVEVSHNRKYYMRSHHVKYVKKMKSK